MFLKRKTRFFHQTIHSWIFFTLTIFGMGCSIPGVSVSGKIVPITTKHSYQGDFKFTSDSHVIIKLFIEKNSEDTETISINRIDGITKFPIHFSIPLDLSYDTENMFISAQVLSGKEDEAGVGDFISETRTPVSRIKSTTIEVSGLENCDDTYAGGFCSQRE